MIKDNFSWGHMGSKGGDASKASAFVLEQKILLLRNSGIEFLKGERLWDPKILEFSFEDLEIKLVIYRILYRFFLASFKPVYEGFSLDLKKKIKLISKLDNLEF